MEEAIGVLRVAQKNWDTTVVRQEIAEAELAINNRKPRVAVADFEVINDIGVPRAGHAIAEELVGNFRPRFDVVERAQTNALLGELKLTNEALYEDESGRTEFGKLSRARYVVLGSVNRLAGISVNARLVDTQSGLIVQTARIVAAMPEEHARRWSDRLASAPALFGRRALRSRVWPHRRHLIRGPRV
jgi:TolB-like protein